MPGLNPTEQDLDQFVEITGANRSEAERFLQPGVSLETAIEDYFATQSASFPAAEDFQDDPNDIEDDEEVFPDERRPIMSDNQDKPESNAPIPQRTGGTTLSGQPAEALPAGWGRPAASRFGRIEDLAQEPGRPSGDDSDDEDEKKGETTYAGGERSGLAIEQPDSGGRPGGQGAKDMVKDILKQATTNGEARRKEESKTSSERKWGAGNTLGSDETPSTSVPAARVAGSHARPNPTSGSGALSGVGIAPVSSSTMDDLIAGMFGRSAAPPPPEDEEEEEAQTRRLTFWRNGFSIEDGPLLPYDTPENEALLQAIQNGRAPPSVFGVRYNQPITIEVSERRREDYQPPPKQPMKAFSGGGNRLGSPTPEIAGAGSSGRQTPTMPGGFGGGAPERSGTPLGTAGSSGMNAAAGGGQSGFAVDESKPTTSIQVRLGDGTKLVAKVNLTHRVGDLRNFVTAARPDPRPFVLQTTFPSKTLDDSNLTIEEAGLKNAVVVQRFT